MLTYGSNINVVILGKCSMFWNICLQKLFLFIFVKFTKSSLTATICKRRLNHSSSHKKRFMLFYVCIFIYRKLQIKRWPWKTNFAGGGLLVTKTSSGHQLCDWFRVLCRKNGSEISAQMSSELGFVEMVQPRSARSTKSKMLRWAQRWDHQKWPQRMFFEINY